MRHALPSLLLLCVAFAPLPSQEPGFEIVLGGAVEATLAGDDATARRSPHPSREGAELRIELDDTRDNCTLVLQINVGTAGEGQEEGTYELRDLLAGIEASRATIICEGLDIRGAQAREGTLRITSADEAGVAGELDYIGEALLARSSAPVEIEVSGSFTSERMH